MVSQLQCWLYRSLYEIARVNTPWLTGHCKNRSSCGVTDLKGNYHSLDGWDAPGFLGYEPNRTAWAVYVNKSFPQLLGGFAANLYLPGGGIHTTLEVSGSSSTTTDRAGYTVYGEAWKAMTGYYPSADSAASTWLGKDEEGHSVCGGEAFGWEVDDLVHLDPGLYLRTKSTPGYLALQVQILEVPESATEDPVVYASYTLSGAALLDDPLASSGYNFVDTLKASWDSASSEYKVTAKYDNQMERDILSESPVWYQADPVVLPLGTAVRMTHSDEPDYQRIGDKFSSISGWLVVAGATKQEASGEGRSPTLTSVSTSGILRASAPEAVEVQAPTAQGATATAAKQTKVDLPALQAGLSEFVSETDPEGYLWVNTAPGGAPLFAGVRRAHWIENATATSSAETRMYGLAFETTALVSGGLQEVGATVGNSAKVDYSSNAKLLRKDTDSSAFVWEVDGLELLYAKTATQAARKVKFQGFGVELPPANWFALLKRPELADALGDIKVTLQFVPAVSGGYGLRALVRAYLGSHKDDTWYALPVYGSFTELKQVYVDYTQTTSSGLQPVPTLQELTLFVQIHGTEYKEGDSATPGRGHALAHRDWALAAGAVSKTPMEAQVAHFVSQDNTGFRADPEGLVVEDKLSWAPAAGEKIGYAAAVQNPNDQQQTAQVLYSPQEKPSQEGTTVKHPKGWYWTVKDGVKQDERYTGGQKTKRFILKQYNSQGELEREWFDYTIPWDVAKNPAGSNLYTSSFTQDGSTQLRAPSAEYKWWRRMQRKAWLEISETGEEGSWTQYVAGAEGLSPTFSQFLTWALKDSHDCFQLMSDVITPLFECTDYKLQLQSDRVVLQSWFESTDPQSAGCEVVHPLLVLKYSEAYEATDDFKAVGWNSYRDREAFAWWNWQDKKGYVYGTANRKDIKKNTYPGLSSFNVYTEGGRPAYGEGGQLHRVRIDTTPGEITDKTARWAEGENHPVSGLSEVSGEIAITVSDKSVKTAAGSIYPSISISAGPQRCLYKFTKLVDEALLGTVFAEGDKLRIIQPGNLEGIIACIYSNSGDLKSVLFVEAVDRGVLHTRSLLPCGVPITIDINWNTKVDEGTSNGYYLLFRGPKSFSAYTWMGAGYKDLNTQPYGFDFTESSTAVEPLYSNTALRAPNKVGGLSLYTVDTSSDSPVVDAWVKASLSGLQAKTEEFQLNRGQQIGFAWKIFYSASSPCLATIVKISDDWSSDTSPVTPATLDAARGVKEAASRGVVGRRPLVNKANNRPRIFKWMM